MTVLVDGAVDVPRSLENDKTLAAKMLRRTKFFVRYLRALYYHRRLTALMAAIHGGFSDSKGWIVERRLELRYKSGKSRTGGVVWDAPITIAVMYKDEAGDLKEACCMSLYIKRNALYIKQLQGGFKVSFPRKFKVWPQLFVKSCIAYAQAANFERVYMPKAHTLYSYRWPGSGPVGVLRSIDALRDHHDRMTRRYNGTAETLGFKSEGNWFVWQNPKLRH